MYEQLFQPVRVEPFDSGYTYALRRIGIEPEEIETAIQREYGGTNRPPAGTILVAVMPNEIQIYDSIDEKGRVSCNWRIRQFWAVCEAPQGFEEMVSTVRANAYTGETEIVFQTFKQWFDSFPISPQKVLILFTKKAQKFYDENRSQNRNPD